MLFQRKQTFDFVEIRRMLWRRRMLILIPLLLTIGGGVVGSFFMEPQYEATATLAKENPVAFVRPVQQATGGGRGMDNEEIRFLRKKILSSSFLESIVVQIGLHESPRILAQTERMARELPGHDKSDLLMRQCVGVLGRMLDIRSEGTDIFYIRAVSNSPEMAYKVASTIATQYVQSDQQTKLRRSQDSEAFAQEQAAIYEKTLEEKRIQLREFEEKAALRPLNSSPVNETTISRVRALKTSAEADIEFMTGRHEAARGKIVEAGLESYLTLGMLDSATLRAFRETIFELERHLAMTLVESLEGDAQVTSAKNQIAAKNQQSLQELESAASLAFPTLDTTSRRLLVDHEYTKLVLESAKRRRDALQEFMNKYAADLASVPAQNFQMSRLKEEVESANRLYQTWQEQAASAQIAKAVQSSDVGDLLIVLEPAKLPIQPFAPNKKNIIALAVFMGLALGIGTAILMEYLDMTLKSVEEIEQILELPILGAVPRMQAAVLQDMESKRRNRIRVLVPATVLTVLALAVAGWFLLVQDKAKIG